MNIFIKLQEFLINLEWIQYIESIVAIVSLYFTYKFFQYKYKLKLYPERKILFDAYKKSILTLLRNGYLNNNEVEEFLISIKESTHLFDSKVKEHLDEVYEKLIDINYYHNQLKDNRDLEEKLKIEYNNNSNQILKYFNKLNKESENKYYKKYLNLSKWN